MAANGSQSSAGGQGADKFKIDVGSPLWRHTTRISQVLGGGSYLWKCNVSNSKKPFNISYSRVKLHFVGPSGKGMGTCKNKDRKGMSNAQIEGYIKEQEEADKLVGRLKQTSYQPPSGKKKCNYPLNQLYPPNIHSCKYLYQKWKRKK